MWEDRLIVLAPSRSSAWSRALRHRTTLPRSVRLGARLTGVALLLSIVVVVATSGPVSSSNHALRFPEYEVKATALYHLGSFVEWPPEFLPAAADTLELCVVGRDPFGSALDFYRGRPVQGRRLSIRRLKRDDDVASCQILFICSSEARSTRSIRSTTARDGVLTVSDMEDFGCKGGAVGFQLREQRVVLRLNLAAVKSAGLRISSNLLDLAEIFDPASCGGGGV